MCVGGGGREKGVLRRSYVQTFFRVERRRRNCRAIGVNQIGGKCDCALESDV
jgi:hypothetical protein